MIYFFIIVKYLFQSLRSFNFFIIGLSGFNGFLLFATLKVFLSSPLIVVPTAGQADRTPAGRQAGIFCFCCAKRHPLHPFNPMMVYFFFYDLDLFQSLTLLQLFCHRI